MPRSSVPKYRKDSKGLAFVEHRSIPTKTRRLYLGRHGTPESHARYRTFLARLESQSPDIELIRSPHANEIDVLIDAYLTWAEKNYSRPHGVSSEYTSMVYALEPVSNLFGNCPVSEFGPRSLVAIRTHLIQRKQVRTGINRQLGRIKKFFRWCCEQEIAPPDLHHKLTCVSGLYTGQEGVREAEKKIPASIDSIREIIPFTSPTVAAMMRTQYLCGMRPGEVCIMRRCDLSMDGETWLYYPQRHKTQWRNFSLVKALPKSAQRIVSAAMNCNPLAYIFQPPKAKHTNSRYCTASYRRAISYAFDKARKSGVDAKRFSPNQLRYAIITDLSRDFGQQKAQRWAGHDDLDTTNIYDGLNESELIEISAELDKRWIELPF